MANEPTLTKQMAVVLTPAQKAFAVAVADLGRVSQAAVVRHGFNAAFGFTPNDQVPGGTTLEQMVGQAYVALTGEKTLPTEVIKTAVARAKDVVAATADVQP